METRTRIALAVAVLALTACSDADSPSVTAPPHAVVVPEAAASNVLKRYVAIGTSVSMGWQSDGVNATTQSQSWPAQLSRLSGMEMDVPYIQGTGCKAPIVAPLAANKRTTGEPQNVSDAAAICTTLQPGIDLPARNLALAGATTLDAINATPQNMTHPLFSRLARNILPPRMSQLAAAAAQNPKVLSIELGANEVLQARSGVAIPGVTIFPTANWIPLYNTVADTAAKYAQQVLLTGLISDVATFPSFRRGSEIFADAPTLLAAFHVSVSSDCDGSANLVFVPVRIPTAIATGAFNRVNGLPPYAFSCADGGLGVQDFVLTPAEAQVVNSTMAAMSSHIRSTASRIGAAYFELQSLYGLPGLKPTFSSVQLMTSAQPYGPYISLDGIHPSEAGHAVLAAAAARALNDRYRLRIPTSTAFVASR